VPRPARRLESGPARRLESGASPGRGRLARAWSPRPPRPSGRSGR